MLKLICKNCPLCEEGERDTNGEIGLYEGVNK